MSTNIGRSRSPPTPTRPGSA